MNDCIGHDIDGRPLRAGDEVVLLRADDEWSKQFLGDHCLLVGLDNDGEIKTSISFDSGQYLAVDGSDVRKLADDHRPANESFHEMMGTLKGEVV